MIRIRILAKAAQLANDHPRAVVVVAIATTVGLVSVAGAGAIWLVASLAMWEWYAVAAAALATFLWIRK